MTDFKAKRDAAADQHPMTTEKPAREFWIPVYEGRARLMCYRQEPVGAMSEDIAHVIEYSAYSALAQRLKEVEAERDKYRLNYEHLQLIRNDYFKTIQELKSQVHYKDAHAMITIERNLLRESLAQVIILAENCISLQLRNNITAHGVELALRQIAKIREKHGEPKCQD